jgi:hypothetical protein
VTLHESALLVAFDGDPLWNYLCQLDDQVFYVFFGDKVASVLVHHTLLQFHQKHGGSLLDCEDLLYLV